MQRESRENTKAPVSSRRYRLQVIWVKLFGCETAFFHAYAAPVEVWLPRFPPILDMLGSGIISSVIKGVCSPGTDKILAF
jgi:hypothetical protein